MIDSPVAPYITIFIKVYEDFDYIGQVTVHDPNVDIEELVRKTHGSRLFTKLSAKYHYHVVKTETSGPHFLKCPCNAPNSPSTKSS